MMELTKAELNRYGHAALQWLKEEEEGGGPFAIYHVPEVSLVINWEREAEDVEDPHRPDREPWMAHYDNSDNIMTIGEGVLGSELEPGGPKNPIGHEFFHVFSDRAVVGLNLSLEDIENTPLMAHEKATRLRFKEN